jgi:two-component sensor histidine kinase
LGIPLGFIVNGLITNATKYTEGNITVRIEATAPGIHSLSVVDEGPGLPAGFDPADGKGLGNGLGNGLGKGLGKGLGMKIIRLLVKQIGGELRIAPGDNSVGARFTITFCSV